MSGHADTIREYLAPRIPNEHHRNCNSHAGLECDCYALRSNAAFAALDALVTELQQQADRIAWLEGDVAGWRIKLAECEERRDLTPPRITDKIRHMSTYEQQLHDLEVRESFALAQGREDLVDEVERERRALREQRDEEEAAEAYEL